MFIGRTIIEQQYFSTVHDDKRGKELVWRRRGLGSIVYGLKRNGAEWGLAFIGTHVKKDSFINY